MRAIQFHQKYIYIYEKPGQLKAELDLKIEKINEVNCHNSGELILKVMGS